MAVSTYHPIFSCLHSQDEVLGLLFSSAALRRRVVFSCVMFIGLLLATATPDGAIAAPPAVPVATPESVGMKSEELDLIEPMVQQGIAVEAIPGCVVLIVHQGKVVFHEAFGNRQLVPTKLPMKKNTIFDMASITKPVATATSVMLLAERGEIRLNEKYGHYVEAFNNSGKDDVTIFQMLTHQAGFVPDSPINEYSPPSVIWPNLWQQKLVYPSTTKFVYSDVGFQMLGKLVEEKSGQTVADFSKSNIFEPLGMSETGYLPSMKLRNRAATTEYRDGAWMQGEVHDPRSYAMGGIAGHAGLFSTAEDMARYAQMILGNGEYAGIRVLSPETVATMLQPHDVAGVAQRALGWDVLSRFSTNRGQGMTDQAVGHGGFTGTAMWIDSGLDLAVIFLSNRVHPNGKGSANRLAGSVASIAVSSIDESFDNRYRSLVELGAETAAGPGEDEDGERVLTGIDVLVRDKFSAVQGQRLGIITNHTGLSRDGKRTIDLLHATDAADLRVIFSPEHGLHGVLDEQINDTDMRDLETGLPIFSLYGESRTPSKEALDQIDTIVFDIQDIGTRFYTYISTMQNAMKAAAESGKRFVVLDRPNPLGGLVVDGPVLDDGKQSFVGCHPITVQHGMTVGELAKMFNSELKLGLGLRVIKVENWRRKQRFDATGLVWVNPSPNMRSWNEALLYPGIGLLEMTNLSVGRGTDRPFEIVAAPYIQPVDLATELNSKRLPGVRFVPRYITPKASKFKGQKCGAVDIVITDRNRFQSVLTGLMIATTLRKQHPLDWSLDGFNRLLCNDSVFDQVKNGKSAIQIIESYQTESTEFKERRKFYLMYE